MTLTRWKLLAGIFGISMVGVVAMANPQCPGKPDASREKAPPTREVQFQPSDAPKTYAVTVPATATASESLPNLVPVATVPLVLPRVEFSPSIPATPLVELPVAIPNVPSFAPVQLPLPDRVIELPLPGVTATKPGLPVPELRLELPKVEPVSLPPVALTSVVKVEPTLLAFNPPTAAVSPLPATPIPAIPSQLAPLPSVDAPVPTRAPVMVSEAPAMKEEAETRVRVVVPLGKSPAKFDVLAGETVLLQAVCEQVEVRSPSEKGGPASPIKASGKVRFTAPGCEGTCDSLAVLPSTGEVELTGSVRVLCKQGKSETEIQAATMKFKLGSAPTPATIPSTFVPNAIR